VKSTLKSKVDTSHGEFDRRRAEMVELVDEVLDIESRVVALSERARPKFEERSQLLPRERLERLLDPGRPFFELSKLAGYEMHDDNGRQDVMGGGNVCGIGYVSGVRCMVIANDSGIKGGSIAPMGLKKSLRAQEIALQNKLPIVSLVESGGANLLYQSELFVEGGRIFCNMARASAAGLPQITVVHGSATAGGAYLPGLSDYVIAVRDRARVFLAGPPLVKAALGEEADEEDLGGANMHATMTGTAEYLADDDEHALSLAREVVAALNWPTDEQETRAFEPPKHDPDELCGVVPIDTRMRYDVREVIARIVDGSAFLEFKDSYAKHTVCGHATIEGQRCGIIGNNGPLTPNDSSKVAQFIQLCCQSNTPLVYLQNTTGYMVGTQAEQAGAVKHGALMIQAVANATVPQFTLIIGGGYGAGNYGMCGRSYDPRFLFAWPNAKVAVMGGEQAAMVMEIITRAKFARKKLPVDEDALKQMGDSIRQKLDAESKALFATARVWDDGIIDPRDSRRVLGFCLALTAEAETRELSPNSFGIART
jgi:geranyl-CoA carboxylase beta subunit